MIWDESVRRRHLEGYRCVPRESSPGYRDRLNVGEMKGLQSYHQKAREPSNQLNPAECQLSASLFSDLGPITTIDALHGQPGVCEGRIKKKAIIFAVPASSIYRTSC